jgi:hypothetical protein
MLESKILASLEDDNLLVLHALDAHGGQYGLSQITNETYLSTLGYGTLYKEAMVQRSAKQLLVAGNASFLDLTSPYSSKSGISLASVMRLVDSSAIKTSESSSMPEYLLAKDLPLGIVSAKTKLSILACKYRIVFSMDASPSMATVDPITGEVLFDQLYFALETVLTALVQPIRFENVEVTPQIHASFLLQGSHSGTLHVMLHGIVISQQTLSSALHILKQALISGESSIITKTHAATAAASLAFSQAQSATQTANGANGLTAGSVPQSGTLNSASGSYSSFPLTDLGSPLKNAMFILKMLPLDACPSIVMLTDAVTMLPEETESYDSLLMLMRREDIVCSAIRVGSSFHDFTSFGYIPDADFLRHFVSCTGGAYFELPMLLENANSEGENRANPQIQTSLLFRTPAGGAVRPKVRSQAVEFGDMGSDQIDHPYPWEGQPPRQSLYSIPFRQYQLIGVNVLDLLSCRYREGFSLHKCLVDGQNPSDVSIKLVLPWKELIFICYTIKATYYNDIPNGTPEIQVALDVLAYYDVQMQWSQQQRPSGPPTSATLLIAKLQQFIICIIDTDKKLNALVSHTIALNEIIGRSLQTPLHVQIEKAFWKHLAQLPKNVWHRWFKMDRMEIILSSDLLLNTAATAMASTTGSRIELRIRAEDLISHPHQSPSIAPNGSSGRDSFSQAGNSSLVFRFDTATKELQSYFDNWNCFSGSKHSFARVLEHTVITGTNTSQIIATISSKSEVDLTAKAGASLATKAISEARTLTVPAYCVLRLTWESKNAAMLSFYFFGVCSADRYKIMNGIHSDLVARANPNDPSTPLFNICRKPLRYSLVRYNMSLLKDMMGPTDNIPTILSNILPSLLSAPMIRSSSHHSTPGGSNSGGSGAAPPPLASQGSPYHTEGSSSRLTQPHHLQTHDPSSIFYSTDDVNLKALASFSPIYHLLVQYMNHKRWIWNINSEVTQEAAIEALVRCRLSEGFLLLANAESSVPNANTATGIVNTTVASRHLLHSFFKEIKVSSDPKSPSSAQSCVVQYLIYHTPQGYLVTELWMEPVHGTIVSLSPCQSADDSQTTNAKSAFEQLMKLIYDVDLHIISTIFTFDTLSLLHNPHTTRDILSVPTEVKEYQLESSLSNVTVQRPPFNLKGLANVAIQHEEYFTCFEKDDNTVLHQCLHASLSYICDRQLPNKGTFAVGESNPPVFAKAIPNSPEILLVTLQPLSHHTPSSPWTSGLTSSSSGNSTPIFPNTPTQPRNSFKPSALGGGQASSQLHPLHSSIPSSAYSPSSSYVPPSSEATESSGPPISQNLVITVYQCSRVVEPPKDSSDRIRALLGTVSAPPVVDEASLPTVTVAGDVPSGVNTGSPTSAAIHQLCEMIQSEHHRGFVKVLYQRLAKGKATDLTSKDHTYALQVCQEYMMELDLTQFFRILAKYSSHEEEIQRRRGGGPSSTHSLGSYGSDSSSPLDATYSSDTSLLFDRILAHQFRRVPHTESHFYLAPHGSSSVPDSEIDAWETDSDATGLSLDEDVAVHITQSSGNDEYESQGEEQDDLDDWIDDLSKRYRSAAVITSTNNTAPAASNTAAQQASNIVNRALSIWGSLPLFIRMECAIVPKSGSSANSNPESSHHTSHWGSEGQQFTPEGNIGAQLQSRSQPRRDSPSSGSQRSQLRPPHSPYDMHSNLDRDPLLNITTFPISTLPNPKQISALQQLSTSGHRALIRVFAIVLPRHGEGGLYEGASPLDMASSPASDGTSPLSSIPVLSKDSVKSGANQYNKLPKVFRKALDQLKSAIRSLTAQKSLDILRLRVPVTRVISDIVSLCMRQLNPNALTTMKIPLLFIDPQSGISLFFNEFPRWSLQPIRVIDRTLFFVVSPNPAIQFFTQPLSITTSAEFNSVSNLNASTPAPDGYSIPYWLFMSPTSTHVHIRFQSPPGLLKKQEKEDILEKTRENIQFVCKRINQILLLTQLYEHRVCNVLLVNDSDGSANSAPEAGDSSSNTIRSPSHPTTPKMDSPRTSKPISIPSRESQDKKRVDRAGDEEGIFEHDEDGGDSSRRGYDSPGIPEAPRLPPASNQDSPLRSLASNSRSSPVTFLPGQFTCEKVHEIHLPLNWRTDPKTILNAIANTVLIHFSVNNRSKMYVYREQSGKIFYMTLSVTSALDEPHENDGEVGNDDRGTGGSVTGQTSKDPSGVTQPTSSIAISSKNSDAEPSAMDLVTSSLVGSTTGTMVPSASSGNLVRSREGTKPVLNVGGETNWLTLRVYGIDAPSEEITVQLRNTLETRLAHFTLQVISTMLLRNPQMRLKPADESFLRSPGVAPRRFQIELPPFITDVNLFRAFVKANLLKQGLSLLNLETDPLGVATASSAHRGGGRTPEAESLLSTPQTPSLANTGFSTASSLYGDAGCVYLYNNVAGSGVVPGGKITTLNFGAGLATLSITIQSPYGSFPNANGDESSISSQSSYEAGSAPLFEPISLEDSPMHDIFLSVLSSSEVQHEDLGETSATGQDLHDPVSGSNRKRRASKGQADLSTFVDIKVWTKGSIEIQKIIEHMEKIVNQTIAEYQFEWYAYLAEARENSPMDYNQFICDAQRLLEHACKLDTPSVRTLNVPINVQSWAIPGYLKELQKRFLELNADFHPDIYYMDVYTPPGGGSSAPSNYIFGNSEAPHMLGRVDLSKRDFLASAPLTASHDFGHIRSSSEVGMVHSEHTIGGQKHSGWRPYEFDEQNAEPTPANQMFFRSTRRFSLLCTKDSLISAWNPKLSSLKVGRDTLASRSVVARSLSSSSSTGNLQERAFGQPPLEASQMTRSFVVLFMDASSHLQLFAYNWTSYQMELMAQHVLRDTNFLNLRQNLVGNILHQKMGLFFHNAPMTELTTSPTFTGPPSLSATSYRSAPQLAKMTRFLPPPCLHASAVLPESTSTSSSVAIQASPLVIRYTFDNLEYLSQTSALPTIKRAKEDDKSILSPSSSSKDLATGASPASNPGSPTPSKLTKRRAIMQKLNDLKIDEILRRISPMVPLSFHADPVFRHAMQFINISERYLRSHQIQQTLLQIYNQWSKRNNSKRVAPTPGDKVPVLGSATSKAEAGDKDGDKGSIDSSQLTTLVRCARLFHTVKIPFFLTDVFLKEDLFEGPTTITYTDPRNSSADTSKTDSIALSPGNSSSKTGEGEDRPPMMRVVPIFPNSGEPGTSPSSSASNMAPPPSSVQPFLYSAGETTQRVISRPELNLRFEPSSHPRERQLKYRQYLLNQFLDQFVTYLATFGVTPVHVKTSPTAHLHSGPTATTQSSSAGAAPNSTPLSRVSHSLSPSDTNKDSPLNTPFSSGTAAPQVDIYPPKQQRYLQKVFRGGLILFEVEGGGTDNVSVSCNVFTLFFNRLTAHFGVSEDVIGARSASSLRHLAHFTREIANIKTQLHMNSFVYDFHVRHISQMFANAPSLASVTNSASSKPDEPARNSLERNNGPSAVTANVAIPETPAPSSVPPIPPVEIINQLQAMAIYYEHPPKHSRTAMASSHITVDVTNALLSPLELFAYATKHAKHFGFHPTDWGLTPGIARLSNSPAFHAFPLAPLDDHQRRNDTTDEPQTSMEEDSWIMLTFMSHTSDATSATNQAISMSLAGGHGALESNYNACYRVARRKHLNAMTLQAQQLDTSHSMPDLPSTSPASPIQQATATNNTSMKVIQGDPVLGINAGPGGVSSAPNLHTTTMVASSSMATISSPLRGKLHGSNAAPRPPKHLTLSFFVLRIPKHTIFPLRASAFATPPPLPSLSELELEGSEQEAWNAATSGGRPVSPPRAASPLLGSSGSVGAIQPPPTSLAAYNRRNMSDALHNCRTLLRDVANRSVVESERDVLWSKLVADNAPSSPDFLNSDQLTQMLRLAHSRPIDLLDPTLASMTSGITTDWKYIMNQISHSYSAFYKTRVFLAEDNQQPHLLIFNPADTDLLIHLSTPDPKRIEALCVRRELNPALEQKHTRLESVHVSQLVNTICHLLWKQLLPKPTRR